MKKKSEKFESLKDLGKLKKDIQKEDDKKDNKTYEKKSESMKNRGMYHPKMKKDKC